MAIYADQASSFTLAKGRGKGHRILAIEMGTINNTDTFDTGLDHIDAIAEMRLDTAASGNDLTATDVIKGVIHFGVAGDVSAAYLTVIGYVKGYAE